jgi:hypothetical protein
MTTTHEPTAPNLTPDVVNAARTTVASLARNAADAAAILDRLGIGPRWAPLDTSTERRSSSTVIRHSFAGLASQGIRVGRFV